MFSTCFKLFISHISRSARLINCENEKRQLQAQLAIGKSESRQLDDRLDGDRRGSIVRRRFQDGGVGRDGRSPDAASPACRTIGRGRRRAVADEVRAGRGIRRLDDDRGRRDRAGRGRLCGGRQPAAAGWALAPSW